MLESPEHREHALKMARQSIVLLRNQDQTLPLRKDLRKIVVLGPNADNSISVLGNYNGTPSKLTTILQGIKDKVGKNTEVVYEKAINFTNDTLLAYRNVSRQYSLNGSEGIKAEYFTNRELSGSPQLVRQESDLNHFWQEGELLTTGIRANDFSARYTTDFRAEGTETLTFEVEADDGYRFRVNGKEVINAWTRNRWGARTYTLQAKKDSVYHLVLEYWQGDGKGKVRLSVGSYRRTDFQALADRHRDADAFIVAGGISPQLEGEEMRVNYPGFNGGDRTSIMLPAVQTELMKTLKTTGKPVVFVLMTGSAVATPWEARNVPAIVNAWYGGQAAGTALADVLFGDYNPAGRLPVTFYQDDADLASFTDYDMSNRTYRYFKGKPLYGFGYGLSYTSFRYDQLRMPKTVSKGKNVSITVRITNTGKMAGEEVPQVYVINQDKSIKTALKVLRGFQRISLLPGESKVVKFSLSPADLSYVNQNGERNQLSGKVAISIGGSLPDESNPTSGNIILTNLQIQ